jgi:hypothetical protein
MRLAYRKLGLEFKAGPDGVTTFRQKDGPPYPKLERTSPMLLADRGYDADWIIALLARKGR